MKKIPMWAALLLLTLSYGQDVPAQQNKGIDSLVKVLSNVSEDTSRIMTLNELSTRLWRISKYEQSKKNAEEALALSSKLNFKKGVVGANLNIGVINYFKNNYTEALTFFRTVIKDADEIGDELSSAKAYSNMSAVYESQGNYSKASECGLTALEIFQRNKDIGGLADIYVKLGAINRKRGNNTEAMKQYLTSLKLAEEIGDLTRIATVHNNIASIYQLQGDYAAALKNYQAVLKIRKETGQKSNEASCYMNISLNYYLEENYPEAMKNDIAAMKIYEEIGDKNGIARAYGFRGEINRKQGNYSEALKNMQLGLDLIKESGEKNRIAERYGSIGDLYIFLKKYPEASENLQNCLRIAKEIGMKETLTKVYEALSELDSAMGNYSGALSHYKLYIAYKDSVNKESNSRQVAQIKEQYESEKKDKEILQLHNDKQKLESEKQISSLLLKNKQDSLLIVQAEKEKVELESEKAQALNLYNLQQIELLGNEKRIQQLQIEKDQADLAVQKAESDKKQEKLIVLGKQKDIQALQLKKQKEAKNYFMAGLVLLAILSFFVYRNFQNQRKLNTLYKIASEKQKAELQLQSLRAQLNPHFMFNSLNAIQELIVMEENEKSQSYLERFAQLLRQLLDNANQPFIPLKKEMGFLDLYLSLEKLRLPDLKYSIEVDPKINAEHFVIPNMMLQPYVENALWHGLQHKQGEKKLELHIVRNNGTIQYEIKDNGVGRKRAEEMKTLYRKAHRSKGMELLSQRFNLLSQEYGQTIQTKVTDLTENGHAAGTLVEISVPVALSEQHNLSHAGN